MNRSTRTLRGIAMVAVLALASTALAQTGSGVVNINTAGEEELTLLPRVGPALAQRIVEFRQTNGKFKAKEELMLVRGIGESTFELIAPYVTLDGATTLKEPVSSGGSTGDGGS